MKTTIIFLLTLFALPAVATNSYLCIGEQGTFYEHDAKEGLWIGQVSSAKFAKYIVKKVKGEDRWEAATVKGDIKFTGCKGFDASGHFQCSGNRTRNIFRFNNQTMNFQYFGAGTYVSSKDLSKKIIKKFGHHQGMIMVFGTCSALD